MGKNKSEKQKKTLHLPLWICDLLDAEADHLGGRPGCVTAAAILMFARADVEQKADYLRQLHEQELNDAYNLAEFDRHNLGINQAARRIVTRAVHESMDGQPD